MKVTKSQIRDEARALFLSGGLSGLSMRKLAKSLGVTAAGLYWHYPSKEALLADVFVDGVEVFFLHRPDGIEHEALQTFAVRRRETFQFLVDRVAECLEDGTLRRVASAEEISLIFLSAAQGLVGLYLSGQLAGDRDAFEAIYLRSFEILLATMKA